MQTKKTRARLWEMAAAKNDSASWTAFSLYCYLEAARENGIAQSTAAELATALGCSSRHVRNIARRLEALTVVEISYTGRRNELTLSLPEDDHCEHAEEPRSEYQKPVQPQDAERRSTASRMMIDRSLFLEIMQSVPPTWADLFSRIKAIRIGQITQGMIDRLDDLGYTPNRFNPQKLEIVLSANSPPAYLTGMFSWEGKNPVPKGDFVQTKRRAAPKVVTPTKEEPENFDLSKIVSTFRDLYANLGGVLGERRKENNEDGKDKERPAKRTAHGESDHRNGAVVPGRNPQRHGTTPPNPHVHREMPADS